MEEPQEGVRVGGEPRHGDLKGKVLSQSCDPSLGAEQEQEGRAAGLSAEVGTSLAKGHLDVYSILHGRTE